MTNAPMNGEVLHVRERIVLAPVTGRFVTDPLGHGDSARPGEIVLRGASLAAVLSSGTEQPVTTPFTGVLAGLLARDGERVREGQPVAWLRVA